MKRALFFAAVAALAFVPRVWAQVNVHSLAAQAGDSVNPYTTAEDAAAGAKVFRAHCATCHGRNAEGFRGPNLTTGRFRHGSSDAALFRNVLQGVPGTSMAGVYLPDKQVWQVISYVRSLGGTHGQETVPGDPARGRAVFEEKGECATCHRVAGDGGRRGTDLSEIGWMRSVAHIRQAILSPSDVIEPNFRLVQLEMTNGDFREGIMLNEDTYSVQFMDEFENLVSIPKFAVREVHKPSLSLMPEYDEAFTTQEMTDLIAYLHSLQGEVSDE